MRIVAFCLLTVAVAVLSACSSASEPPMTAPLELSLTARDIAYDTNRLEVTAGRPVKLTLNNEGALEHDFSITALPHTGAIVEGEVEMAGHDMEQMSESLDIHVAAAPSDRNSVEFTPAEPGEYEFYCTVPGHKEAGMQGVLIVQAP